ncbi:hypothetical protein SPV_2490 [Streptococcus pneumoniae]|nr:hypothetical protein SPV_2490 [Streptococcus pneumoniae]
MVLRTNRRK